MGFGWPDSRTGRGIKAVWEKNRYARRMCRCEVVDKREDGQVLIRDRWRDVELIYMDIDVM